MKIVNSVISIGLALLLPSVACSFSQEPSSVQISPQSPAPSTPAVLLNATLLTKFDQASLIPILAPYGINPRNGLSIYRVSYQTQSLDETPLQASGIILVPETESRVFPWISLQHGTLAAKAQAPSFSPSEGLAEASQGFVTVVADYIGYGDSQDLPHPYIIEEGYQTSLVDMLRAAREFASDRGLIFGPLFLKGYSEGGYATLALQKTLESKHTEEFPIVASAPSAGPYDVDLTGRLSVAKPIVNPVNIPFLVLSYDHWLADGTLPLDDIFIPTPEAIKKALSGAYSAQELFSLLPTTTTALFEAEFVTDFLSAKPQDPANEELHRLLESQSLLTGWSPKAPTRFYHCQDDEQIPVALTEAAIASFKDLPNVSSIILTSPNPAKPFTHSNCPVILSPIQWFAEILMTPAA